MSSQFDALLDFGDQPAPTSNGGGHSNANGSDDFDPFGPGPQQVSGKGGVGDGGGLLLDFSVGADASGKTQNGTGASDPFDTQFTINASLDTNNSSSNLSSTNPFSDMSTTETQQPSANPLYDLTDDDLMSGAPQGGEDDYKSSSANPLYDFSTTEEEESGQAEYTFETTTTTTTTEESSANPLYDLMESDLSGGQQVQEEPTTTGGGDDDFLSSLPDLGKPFGRKPFSAPSQEVDVVLEASDDISAAQSYELQEDPAIQRYAQDDEEEEVVEAEAGESELVLDQIVPDVVPQQETGVPTLLGREVEEEDVEAEQPEQNVELYIREEGEEEPQEQAVGSRHVEEELEDFTAEQQQQQYEEVEETRVEVQPVLEVQRETEKSRSRSRSPSNHSISSEGEVLNEEEELRQDGRTLYKTKEEKSYNETRYDGKPAEGYGSADVTDYGQESDLAREHREKEDFHFQEMSSVKSQFERGPQQPQPQPRKQIDIRQEVASVEAGVYESQPQTFQPQYGDEETEEGVYENTPEQRSDVVRESDRNIGAELPSVGTAKNIREKFLSGKVEKTPTMKREMTPPEIVSGGVYESQPKYNPDVVHAGEPVQEEILPEHGTAKNLAAKFKQMEKQGAVPLPSQKREITPDRTTKVEYVSEPRGHVERYEPEIQAGVFESQPATRDDVVKSDQAPEEILPERGAAKNIAAKFKQLTSEQSNNAASPRNKRELTPDTTGRVEYVSEPTGYVERYEGKAESGVFESQPAEREDVVKSDQLPEEILPERGTARNMAARFKEMEKSTSKSPATPGKYKEFTPPRENGTPTHGVYESTPQVAADVVHAEDAPVDIKPERGTARNIADKFRQLGSSESAPKSPRAKKEFTPPPQTQAVYENTPKQFIPDYNRPPESGILESKPEVREDVVRSDSLPNYEQELPERGCTRNLVSAWRQRESESSKISPTGSGKPKEFTPPREEPRVASQRNQPRTPKSPMARGGDMNAGSVNPIDLPGQYQPQAEPTVFESEPQKLEGVVSENDTDWNAGLPKADTTKKMLAKFQQIQAQAQADTSSPKPQPQARKIVNQNQRKEGGLGQSNESSPEKVGRSKSMRVAVQLEKCGACDKTVYAMEKIEIEKHSYHKSCFRCSHCHCVLTPKTFAINQKVMFCTTHYKQLFATKGNYDEGFGHDQHKKRWKSEPNLADDEQQQQHSNHT